MENIDLEPLIESLDENIDDLEETLEPLLRNALSDTAGKLPLLDKAQLYVLVTYAIESILFCMPGQVKSLIRDSLIVTAYLRLNGVNSKEHPVFRELTRVKQYFEKVKAAESVGTKQNATLDKAAAGRFIKHALVRRNHCALGFASADRNIRLGTTNVTTKWPKKTENKWLPFIQDLKVLPGNRNIATTWCKRQELSLQVIKPILSRSI